MSERIKHTPGPWRIAIGGEIMADPRPLGVIEPKAQIIVEKFWAGLSFAERSANARLIAAAPELLEALTRLTEQFNKYLNGWMGDSFRIRVGLPLDMELAETALRKVKGTPMSDQSEYGDPVTVQFPLIAAAPEMLRALELAEQTLSGVPVGQDEMTILMARIRAAITKARGL